MLRNRFVRCMSFPAALAIACGTAATLTATVSAQPAGAAKTMEALSASEKLPIRRITLYRSGVASFERRGMVQDNAKVQLRFTTEQINDILKSMVVLDLSKGRGQIDGISYGSKEPLAKRLSSFGIDISKNPAAAEILAQLRGTPVKLQLQEGEVRGTIMNIETRPTVYEGSEKGGATKFDLPWINLVTEKGIRSYNMAQVMGFEILDENLAAELNKALSTLAEYRADRTKTVDVMLSGEGTREIVVAYVQESPVWKTSYRLVLPDDKADGATGPDTFTIQGWAIVENTTDDDWENVSLSLVSGRPVSFRMDLYEPMYVPRPELPVPTVPGALARVYEGGQATRLGVADAQVGRPRAVPGSPAPASKAGAPGGGAERRMMAEPAADNAPEMDFSTGFTGAVFADSGLTPFASGQTTGEVFSFELDRPVTVERQRSAMLPIIGSGIEGRRVSIFSPGDGSSNPMRGVELTNNTGLQLMPGPISVFDNGVYAGDAQIGHVPAGDKRLLAYSVDLDVSVITEPKFEESVRKVRIVNGVFELTMQRRMGATYSFENKDQKCGRTIILEQPKQEGWTLLGSVKPIEVTQNSVRFEIAADSGKKTEFPLVYERTDLSQVGIFAMNSETLLSYTRQGGQVSQAVMDALREVQRRQNAINDFRREIGELDRQAGEINADQGRIRQNLGSIDRTSQLYSRYMQRLTEQETTIEDLTRRAADKRAELAAAEKALNEYIAALNIE